MNLTKAELEYLSAWAREEWEPACYHLPAHRLQLAHDVRGAWLGFFIKAWADVSAKKGSRDRRRSGALGAGLAMGDAGGIRATFGAGRPSVLRARNPCGLTGGSDESANAEAGESSSRRCRRWTVRLRSCCKRNVGCQST